MLVTQARELALAGRIVLFGIRPTMPETGFGYLECAAPDADGAAVVRRFVEKPDADKAAEYLASGHFLLNGLTLISDAEDATGVELADEGFDTVGGFMMAKLGRIPKVGDRVPVPGWEFRVTAMDGRRVARVLVMRSQPPGGTPAPDE